MTLINSHTHLECDKNIPSIVNATNPDDWEQVKKVCRSSDRLYAAFGIHPWYITPAVLADRNVILDRLQTLLAEPYASLGEVGLDNSIGLELSEQERILEDQLSIADNLKSLVSIHCFAAFHRLLPIIKKHRLTYILHGYNGSPEITKSLLEYDTYFSFGGIQSGRMSKVAKLLEIIPPERLLTETDSKPNVDLVTVAATLCRLKPLNEDIFAKNFYRLLPQKKA